MADDLTVTAAILSALIILKEAFFQFWGSKTERQVDRLIEAIIAEQRTLNERLRELLQELATRR